MNNEFTAVVKQDGAWWIGWIEEVPGVNCQEATRDELIESLTVTLREALDLNREDALAAAGDLYSEEKIGARSGACSSFISAPTAVISCGKAAAIHGGTTRL